VGRAAKAGNGADLGFVLLLHGQALATPIRLLLLQILDARPRQLSVGGVLVAGDVGVERGDAGRALGCGPGLCGFAGGAVRGLGQIRR